MDDIDIDNITFGDLNNNEIKVITSHYTDYENVKIKQKFNYYAKVDDDGNDDGYNELLADYDDIISEYENISHLVEDLENKLYVVSIILGNLMKNELTNISVTDVIPLSDILPQANIDVILRAKKLKIVTSIE